MRSSKLSRCCLLAAGLLCSCNCAPKVTPSPVSAYLSDPAKVASLRRVVMMELKAESAYVQVAQDMTDSLCQALQAKGLFRIDLVRRDDPAYQDLPLATTGPYRLAEVAVMRKAFQADALLVGRITTFQPHPRMRIGLQLRLWDLNRGELVWGMDHTWDTTEKSTEQRIQAFFRRELRGQYEPAGWELAMLSPGMLSKFVAREAADSLAVPSAGKDPPPRKRPTLVETKDSLHGGPDFPSTEGARPRE